MSEESVFTVGPPEPVTDSRHLPATTPDDEAGFVHGADLENDHPDNRFDDLDATDLPPDETEDPDLPGDDELAGLLGDVDPDAVDPIGFDDSDTEDPVDVEGPGEGGS